MKFTSIIHVLSVTVLFICVISCWCSLKTITYVTKLPIIQLSLSSCYVLSLPNIVASTLLSVTFIFHRKCSFHGDCCFDVVWTDELRDCGIHILHFIPVSPYLMITDPQDTVSETSDMNSTLTWLIAQGTPLHCRSVH